MSQDPPHTPSHPLLQKEGLRKLVHLSGLFTIPLLSWNRTLYFTLFFGALAVYFAAEIFEKTNRPQNFLTRFVQHCKRTSEKSKIARGPVLLALAALITPLLFETRSASLALGQVYLADTASTWVGMKWGRKKLFYSKSKSWAGSIAFFISAFLISLPFASPPQALILALLGAVIESLPIPEWDNLLIPLGVGFLCSWI